jgi:hypothetical protein
MIPLHALVLILMGRFSNRLYVAYSTWYVVGTLASMQVPFVGFQPVSTSEHMAALGNTSSPRILCLYRPSLQLRCFRLVAAGRFHRTRSLARCGETLPDIVPLRIRCHRIAWICSIRRSYDYGQDRTMDWSLLLSVGY